jgi:hypothetical protein
MFHSLASRVHIQRRSRQSRGKQREKGKTIMIKARTFILMSTVMLGAAFTATFNPTARADEWDKMTKVTITEPIEVPGAVLQPGTYIFKLLNLESQRHVVEVMNDRQDKLFATIMAINTERLEPHGKTVFTFYETPAGQPPAVKKWYYPGDNFGQEFIYRKGRVFDLSQAKQTEVRTEAAQNTPPPTPAPEPEVVAPAPAPEPPAPVIAQNEPPAAAPPAPAPAPETPAPAVLPQTASEIPLLALIGLLSLGAATALRTVKKAA